jgi:hypothetical protein
MSNGAIFDWLCQELERASSLSRIEARGTVRIALKHAGLEPRTLTEEQLAVVLERVLPAELAARAVDDGEGLCARLLTSLRTAGPDLAARRADAPEDVFRRLGGG